MPRISHKRKRAKVQSRLALGDARGYCLHSGRVPSHDARSAPEGDKGNLPLKKANCEAEAQRRPARSERKNRAFSAKRQAVWFETRSVSN